MQVRPAAARAVRDQTAECSTWRISLSTLPRWNSDWQQSTGGDAAVVKALVIINGDGWSGRYLAGTTDNNLLYLVPTRQGKQENVKEFDFSGNIRENVKLVESSRKCRELHKFQIVREVRGMKDC